MRDLTIDEMENVTGGCPCSGQNSYFYNAACDCPDPVSGCPADDSELATPGALCA